MATEISSSQAEKNLAQDRNIVQRLLQSGLVLATLLMMTGIIMKISGGSLTADHVGLFQLGSGSLSLADRITAMGILALASTPAFRVLALLILWYRERDWKFALVAGIVMAVLVLAISMGGG